MTTVEIDVSLVEGSQLLLTNNNKQVQQIFCCLANRWVFGTIIFHQTCPDWLWQIHLHFKEFELCNL